MGKFVGKSSRVATILSLGIEHRTAADSVPSVHETPLSGRVQVCR